MAEYILVLSTVPDEIKGKEIARKIVGERLAACVTLSSPCQSFYWWEEKIAEDAEFMLFIKTRVALFPDLEKRLKELHPYTVPEIIGIPIDRGHGPYLEWVEKETKG